MKIIKFTEHNATFAKNQPPYLPLPAYRTDDGQVISCWGLSFRERLRVLLKGRVYLKLLTFNQPLQPQRISTNLNELIK